VIAGIAVSSGIIWALVGKLLIVKEAVVVVVEAMAGLAAALIVVGDVGVAGVIADVIITVALGIEARAATLMAAGAVVIIADIEEAVPAVEIVVLVGIGAAMGGRDGVVGSEPFFINVLRVSRRCCSSIFCTGFTTIDTAGIVNGSSEDNGFICFSLGALSPGESCANGSIVGKRFMSESGIFVVTIRDGDRVEIELGALSTILGCLPSSILRPEAKTLPLLSVAAAMSAPSTLSLVSSSFMLSILLLRCLLLMPVGAVLIGITEGEG